MLAHTYNHNILLRITIYCHYEYLVPILNDSIFQDYGILLCIA